MTTLHWISGTACDLFMSLFVLHHAADFGVRPAWAAGVRQRLSPENRATLERIYSFATIPLPWVSTLPSPPDARTALQMAAEMPASQRLVELTLKSDARPRVVPLLEAITRRGKWSPAERQEIMAQFGELHKPTPRGFDNLLNSWLAPARVGEELLKALNEYHQVFYTEEEQRIRPALEAGLASARSLANQHEPAALVEVLTNGVSLEESQTLDDLTLLPSWWVAPLTVLERPEAGKTLLAFSVRPAAPTGAEAPETLVAALKSLGDPTRLRILHYLAVEPLSPSELARRLRLRPPTVIHHLHLLRAAGLVQVTVSRNMERRYAARPQALNSIFNTLHTYLNLNGKHR